MLRRYRRMILSIVGACLIAGTAAAQPVRIGIPERDNIQYLSLWVALGAGFLQAEGLDVEIVFADVPNQSGMLLVQKRADVTLLQPPVYLGLIAQQQPIALFANLLANDPINLVVQPAIAAKLAIDPRAPLADRLKALKGLRVGVAPEPPRRLRVLFAHAGLDADRDVQITIVRGEDQVAAFKNGTVDALYAHTPYLEEALVNLGAVMVVNQSGGEVTPLSNGQIHSLGAMREYANAHPEVLVAITRAIARAQALVKKDTPAAIQALVKAGIAVPSQKHLETIVNLYRVAVPATPNVSAAAVERNAKLYPARPAMPDFTRIHAADYLAPAIAEQALRSSGDDNPRFDLGVIEVSVTAPAASLAPLTHTMDRGQIRNQQALTVKDAIEYLPGVAVDLSGAVPMRSGVSVQAGVKNLFDRNYYYWEGFPEAGRNSYVTLRYAF